MESNWCRPVDDGFGIPTVFKLWMEGPGREKIIEQGNNYTERENVYNEV